MGGSGPPPKVDNSAKRTEWVSQQASNRQQQADAYNQRVRDFNDSLQGFVSEANNARQKARSLTIKDDELFGSFDNIADRRNALATTTWNESAPTFASSVSSPYGDDFTSGIVDLSVPTLFNPNNSLRTQALSDFDEVSNIINNLRTQRTAEEQRVRSTFNTLNSGIGTLMENLRNAQLEDFPTQRNQFQQQLGTLRGQYDGFSSLVLDDGFLAPEWSGISSRFEELNNEARGFQDRFNTARTGALDYERSVSTQASDFLNRLMGASINDIDLINEADRNLNTLRAQASTFNSPIPVDLSQEIGVIDQALGRVNTLRSRREAEEARLEGLRDRTLDEVMAIRQMAGNIDPNSESSINSIMSRMDDLNFRANNIRSPLSGGGADDPLLTMRQDLGRYLGEITGRVGEIRNSRQSRIDALVSQLNQLSAGTGTIPLQDETSLMNQRGSIDALMAQLSGFSGSDISGIRGQFDTARSGVDARLRELATRRSQIETQLRSLVNSINNGTFNDVSALSPFQSQLDDLRAQQQTFGAQQALDEIDAASLGITQTRQRIEREAQVRAETAARERAEQEARQRAEAFASEQGSLMPGVNIFGANSGALGNLTPEQIAMILAISNPRRDQYTGIQYPSSFSSNVMVV